MNFSDMAVGVVVKVRLASSECAVMMMLFQHWNVGYPIRRFAAAKNRLIPSESEVEKLEKVPRLDRMQVVLHTRSNAYYGICVLFHGHYTNWKTTAPSRRHMHVMRYRAAMSIVGHDEVIDPRRRATERGIT